MAAKYPEEDLVYIPDEEEEEEEDLRGPSNRRLADNYAISLDDVLTDFREMVSKDKKDALKITVSALKR